MTAADGQSLATQDPGTQATFQAVWGDQAAQQWDTQHNAAIGATPQTTAQSTPGATQPGPTTPTVTNVNGQGYIWDAASNSFKPAPGLPPTQTDTPGLNAFSAQASGVTAAQLAEMKRQFDASLAWQQQMWQNQGLPQLVIAQKTQQLQEQEYQSQLALAQQNVALQQAGVLGYYSPPSGAGAAPGGAAWSAPTQQQYMTARTQQLQGMGFDPTRAQETANAEWAQGFAQSGNVAGGLPSGISFTQPAPTVTGAGTWGAPGGGIPTLAAQQMWAQLYGQNTAPGAGEQTLAARQQQFEQALAAAGITGTYQGAPTLAAQQQVFSQRQALAQQGLQYLSQASQLQGPQNVFQQSNFYRGAQNNPDIPVFLQALQQNTRMPAFTATGTPATPLSMGTLAGSLTGVSGMNGGTGNGTAASNAGFNANASLNAVRNLSNRGAQSLAPGSLERLTPDELSALGSGLGAVGNSLPAFLQAYQQSRPAQTATTGDMSLAA